MKIGLKIKYNKDITAIVIDENETHVLIETDKGNKFCVVNYPRTEDSWASWAE